MPRIQKKPLQSLVIGLGGSGAVTIRHLKSQLENMYDEVPGNVGLLVFDTDVDPSSQHDNLALATLTPREYGHLGGNARAIFEKTAADDPNYAHFAGWLRADYYLKNLNENMFQLQKGAGMWRQFGRMALFRDVLNASDSNFYRLVQSRMNGIISSEGGGLTRPLNIFLVGSLVGGTGAGTFIDAAFLTRQIAQISNIKTVNVRGLFWLPEAFASTLNANQRADARPRTFAALRELSRFVMNDNYLDGYPMFYHNELMTNNARLWRAHLNKKLFDLIYLMDGKREHEPLSVVKTTVGVASSVADAILAFMDSSAGAYYESHTNNLNANTAKRGAKAGKKPLVGSLGAYSVILPIQQIVEGWSYRLGLDVLRLLLPAHESDSERGTGRILRLAVDSNGERSHSFAEESRLFFTNTTPQSDPDTPSDRAYPTGLWKKLYDWSRAKDLDDTRKAAAMARAAAGEWIAAIRPNSADRGEAASRAVERINVLIDKTVEKEIQNSRQHDRADAREDNTRIVRETRQFYDKQLGRLKSKGDREGGDFRIAVKALGDYQVDRFRVGLQYFLKAQLNGTDAKYPEVGRKGKLGWTIALMNEIEAILDNGARLIQLANSDQIANQIRQRASEALDLVEKNMEEARRANNRKDAERAQDNFFTAATALLDVYRAEVARQIVEETILQMREYVRDVIKKLSGWANVLALHHDSLYSQFLTGEQRVITRRRDDEAIKSRWTLSMEDTKEWEDEKYKVYSESQDALRTALGGMKWKVEQVKDTQGREKLSIDFTINGASLRDDMRGEWYNQNTKQLIGFCDSIFANVKERESLAQFLATYKFSDNVTALAERLIRNSGAMLSYDPGTGDQTLPGFLLVAERSEKDNTAVMFVNELKEALAHGMGLASDDANAATLISGDDAFRITLVSTRELIPLDATDAFTSGVGDYMTESTETRQTLHVFPAEVNAVVYEDRLPTQLRKQKRMFTPHVTTLVEDIESFRLFLQLMAHRVVFEDRNPTNPTNPEFVYFLAIEDANGNLDFEETIWLTKPAPEPSLMDAMYAFIVKKKDMGRMNREQFIDFDKVKAQLDRTRQRDTNLRLESGADEYIGVYESKMYDWMVQYQAGSAEYNALARSIVEYDVLRQFDDEYLAPKLNELESAAAQRKKSGTAVDQDEAERDLIDMYTMARLVLIELCDARAKDIKNQAGMGR